MAQDAVAYFGLAAYGEQLGPGCGGGDCRSGGIAWTGNGLAGGRAAFVVFGLPSDVEGCWKMQKKTNDKIKRIHVVSLIVIRLFFFPS